SDRRQIDTTKNDLDIATRELQRTRTERAQLETKAVDVRSEIQMLNTTLAVKKSEIGSAERTLESLYSRVAAANERLAEVEKLEDRVQLALSSLKTAEKQRDVEEKNLVDLEVQRETLRREVITLGEQEKLGRSKLEDLTRRAEKDEARLQSVQQKTDALATEVNAKESQLVQLERNLQATIDEEKAIRAGMPELNAEMTTAHAALHELLGRRSQAESEALNLAKDVSNAEKKLAELDQQSNEILEEKARREREIADLQTALESQESSIQKVLDDGLTAGKRLEELKAAIQEHEQLHLSSTQKHDQLLKQLRDEEAGIMSSIEALQRQHGERETNLVEVQSRLSEAEKLCNSLVQSGDRIVSLQEATSQAEARRRDAESRLSQFAELELSLQVRLNSLQDTVRKETHRLDQLRQEREQVETQVQKNLDKASRDAEEVKKQLSEEIQAEEVKLIAQLKQRNSELIQKHDELKKGITDKTDEQTVIFFAGDVIKRLDLIDNLIQRYAKDAAASAVAQQLRTLRSSFEDVLAQHGVSEFSVRPGTDVDVALRLRIAVVENVGGNGKAKVVESYRPGFIYAPGDGREIVLRKVEVKTSSE
ncbi:MAG: nucleotide exchange factor GrpE, partial [Verrucomicrobium sp.]